MFLLGGNLTCGLRIGHAMFDFDMSETETSGCFDFFWFYSKITRGSSFC